MRIEHLERDLGQKRTLIDSLKQKVQSVQETALADASMMIEVEAKILSLSEENGGYKRRVNNLKQGIDALKKEKCEMYKTIGTLSEEIERKTRQLNGIQTRNAELQKQVSVIQRDAHTHLDSLSTQTEDAINTAQKRLVKCANEIVNYKEFIKLLTEFLLGISSSASSKVARSRSTEHLDDVRQAVQDVLSRKDDDLNRSTGSDTDTVKKKSNEDLLFARQLKRIMTKEVNFASKLAALFIQRIRETRDSKDAAT